MNTRRIRRGCAIGVLLVGAAVAPAAAAVVNGTSGPDVLTGTKSADTIHGEGGADTIYADRGRDKVYGGYGADRIYSGKDSVKDVLQGGPGADRIFARYNGDTVRAGHGNDTIRLASSSGGFTLVYVYCGPGRDTVYSPFGGWLIGANVGCERWISPD